jgi:hypothetical protein
MKKKCATKKKYGYGSSGTISPQLENPINTIYQSQIDSAYASSQHSDLVNGLNIFGGAAMGVGGQMMAAGKMDGNSGFAKFVNNNGKGVMSGLGTINASSQFLATGGIVNSNTPIEAEGQEVMETPNGQVSEIEGASHEQGGVNMNVPEGTKIYSKRIEKFGETMAERKKVREKKLTNLNKLLENSKGDVAVKNAYKRSVEALNEQEQTDLQTQEMYGAMAALHEHTFGTNENNTEEYAGGTGPYGISKKSAKSKNLANPDFMLPSYGQFQEPISNREEKPFSMFKDMTGVPYAQPIETSTLTTITPEQTVKNAKILELGKMSSSKFVDNNKKTETDKLDSKMPGIGDMIGMAGNLYSAFAPMNNTLENRAGDTPNVNSFKDYGEEGLKTIDKTKQYVNQVRDEKLQNLELDRTGAIKRNSNSARGVNTMRALNLATDAGINNQKDATYDTFAQQMMGILGQEAGMQNQKDQVVMTGEQEKDLNDRKDRDNFYTQLGKDKSTMGEGVQNIGKDLNAMKQNKMMTNVINQLSKYGLAFDEKGNLIEKPKTT